MKFALIQDMIGSGGVSSYYVKDNKAYDFNYDRIFRKASNTRKEIKEYNTELEACRLKSKTFSMEQD